MGRLTSLRDLGLLAVYLASSASSCMTGQAIYLDGGETAVFLQGDGAAVTSLETPVRL